MKPEWAELWKSGQSKIAVQSKTPGNRIIRLDFPRKGWKKGISAIYKYVKMAIEKNEKHCARSTSEK